VQPAPQAAHPAARLPVVEPAAEHEEQTEQGPAQRRHLAGDGHARAPEEFERRLAPEHREHDVVRDRLGAPALVLQHRFTVADLTHLGAEAQLEASRRMRLRRERPGGGGHVLRSGSLDRDVGHRVALQALEFLEIRGLGARQLRAAAGEGDVRARHGERDRGLGGGVAAAHHQGALAGEIGGVVEAVVHAARILARDLEHAEAAGATDRDQHAPRAQRLALGEDHEQVIAALPDALGAALNHVDLLGRDLALQLLDQCLLHRGSHREPAGGLHRERVGVDRLSPGKVDERRERPRRFDHAEREAAALRFDRGREARDPGAHDHQIERAGRCRPARKIGGDLGHDARAGIERELEERDALQIAREVHARHGRAAVRAYFREALDGAGGPAPVEPARVTPEPVEHHDLLRENGHRGTACGAGAWLEMTRRAAASLEPRRHAAASRASAAPPLARNDERRRVSGAASFA
jgi:hypothetical protein